MAWHCQNVWKNYPSEVCHKCNDCVMLMIVADPLESNKYWGLYKHFKLSAQLLQKPGGKKCTKLTKNLSFFFQISWKIALWKNVNSAKILQCLRFLHIYRNSTKSTFSEDDKSFEPHLQRLGSQRPKKWTRITKIGYANIYRPHVEIKESKSQQMDKICTKTGYVNTFAPRNPSRHTQITFFF